jgi:hypothetical protein
MYWYAHIKPTGGLTGISAGDFVNNLARFDRLTRTQEDTWSSADSRVWFTLTAMQVDNLDSYHSTGILPNSPNFIACVGSASSEPEVALEIFEQIALGLGWEFVMEEPWYII